MTHLEFLEEYKHRWMSAGSYDRDYGQDVRTNFDDADLPELAKIFYMQGYGAQNLPQPKIDPRAEKIKAIKHIRTNCNEVFGHCPSLKLSKDFVDAICAAVDANDKLKQATAAIQGMSDEALIAAMKATGRTYLLR